jgi:hypothetical protein
MNNPPGVWITEEALKRVLTEVRQAGPSSPIGVGAPGGKPPKNLGFGQCSCDMGPLEPEITSMLGSGSPRLALAVARGVPLAPYMVNVRAIFPDTTTAIIPDVGSDVKISQDLMVEALVVRTVNESETANQNQFQSQSDFFYGIQSGLEATLDVKGAPRYTVADTFTPLSTLGDVAVGNSFWPRKWVLLYQQQLFMSFRTTVLLPFAPIEVICTFRTRGPVTEEFSGATMSNRTACELLQKEFGITLDSAYVERVAAL